MKIVIPKEIDSQETRVTLLPTEAGKLVQLGAEVVVESGIGDIINIPDADYEKSGEKRIRRYLQSI